MSRGDVNLKRVAIAVPVYKKEMSGIEKISYNQLLRVLGRYDIYWVCSDNLDAGYLKDKRKKIFSSRYFDGINGYNKLMLSVEFYSTFINYEYILIYQLDALVFCDKLLEFCDLNYDYIGAPWLTGFKKKIKEGFEYANVGNGGLSLRKTAACIELLSNHKEADKFSDNEDQFFAFHDGQSFSVAPSEIALKFSFEREVQRCYALNNNELPFGCHAWFKYDLDFWRPIITDMGYDISFITDPGNLDEIMQTDLKMAQRNQKFWCCDQIMDTSWVKDRELLIWGSGLYGKRTMRILKNSDVKIYGFIDSDEKKTHEMIEDYEIWTPDVLKQANQVIVVAIVGESGEYVGRQLTLKGKKYKEDYFFYSDLTDYMI